MQGAGVGAGVNIGAGLFNVQNEIFDLYGLIDPGPSPSLSLSLSLSLPLTSVNHCVCVCAYECVRVCVCVCSVLGLHEERKVCGLHPSHRTL